jgi:hypothetical protein
MDPTSGKIIDGDIAAHTASSHLPFFPSNRFLTWFTASMHQEPHSCPRGSWHRYREGHQGECVFG